MGVLAQSPEQPSEWSEALFEQWWRRMSEIFGRDWVDKNGSKPTASWREELSSWSVLLSAAVLVHYRRAGLRFPPNLSEVAKTAHELKPGLVPLTAPREYRPNDVDHALAVQRRRDQDAIANYRRDNPGASVAEAAVVLLGRRGMIQQLPASVLAAARAAEAAALQRGATVTVAKAKDFGAALEDMAEREAIRDEPRE